MFYTITKLTRLSRQLIIIALSFTILSFTNQSTEKTYSLTVEVFGMRNSDGIIQFALYNTDGSIPDEHFDKYYKMKTGKITSGKASITFVGLPPGNYAVNVLHDENENGKVDKGFMMPKEGLGFSNYESLGFSNRPKYTKAKFELTTDKSIKIKVIYM